MSNQIFNTASLTFEFGSQTGCAFSNTASANLLESLTMQSNSLGSNYFWGSTVIYIINVRNNSTSESKNLEISDNLASYSSQGNDSNTSLTPLEYDSPSFLYIDGNLYSEISPEIKTDKIIFKISSIPANSNITLIYKLTVNQYAPIYPGSTLTSTITLNYEGAENPITSQILLTAEEKADVKIIKNMHPSSISIGEELTYHFFLYNYGNTNASNVTLTDTFSPIPNITSIQVDSKDLTFSDYSYLNGTLTVPSYGSSFNLSIPAAEFTTNSKTGLITANPGTTHVVVKGKI